MRLAAIYNVFDGVELLNGSINCIKDHVDLVIIIHQEESNFGEKYNGLEEYPLEEGVRFIIKKYNPIQHGGFYNETQKRNEGLAIARQAACTHFFHIDVDEYYEDFTAAKQQYIDSGKAGSACRLFTYFKKPTLRFETEDGYYVPFIHELKSGINAGALQYPYHADPTRRINETDVALLDVHMHHFSWVRKDIERKARNSSARKNISRGTIMEDYKNQDVGPGFYVRDFDKKLIEVPNQFNINI